MSGISVGGLSSGIDTTSIVQQLVAIEQAKVTREQAKQDAAQATLDKFSDLQTRLVNLANKSAALDDTKDFNLFNTLSNNDEYAVVNGGEDAVDGSYELVVRQLATTQKVSSGSFAKVNTALNLAGTFEVSTSAAAQKADSTKKTVSITVSATDTLKDVASKINSTDGIGVRASLMSLANGENRLILTSVDEGSDGFYMKGTSGADVLGSSGLSILASNQSAATDSAFVTLAGDAATGSTKFSELTTGLIRNDLNFYEDTDNDGTDDVIGNSISFSGVDASGATKTGTLQLRADTTMNDLVASVQTAFGSGTKVSLNNSGEIVLTSTDGTKTGTISLDMKLMDDNTSTQDNTMAFKGTSVRNTFLNSLNEGQNAFYTIDGMAVTSQKNSDDSTIVGTTFVLKKADPSVTVKVSLEQNNTGISDKIKEFVEEYNSLMSFLDENMKVTVKEETDEDGKKTSTRTKGAFAGDSNVSSLKEQLRRMMTGTVDPISGRTQYSSLSRIGITSSRSGALEVDDDALTEALENDLDGVRRLFTTNGFSDTPGYSLGRYTDDTKTGTYYLDVKSSIFGSSTDGSNTGDTGTLFGSIFTSSKGGSNGLSVEVPAVDPSMSSAKFTFVRGIAAQFSLFVDNAQDYVDGYFKTSKDSYQKRVDSYNDKIETLQTRVDNYETRLNAQFTALEQSISKLKTQTTNMLSQLSS